MTCQFRQRFLKELADLPTGIRARVEKLVFITIPGYQSLREIRHLKLLRGHSGCYRIRISEYRIGCTVPKGGKIVFERIRHRRDIYRVFP